MATRRCKESSVQSLDVVVDAFGASDFFVSDLLSVDLVSLEELSEDELLADASFSRARRFVP
jgi:hypothetical protein